MLHSFYDDSFLCACFGILFTVGFCFVLAKMTYEQMVDFKSFTSFHKHISDQMDNRLQCQYWTFPIWTRRSMARDTMFSFVPQQKSCLINCQPSLVSVAGESGSNIPFKSTIKNTIIKISSCIFDNIYVLIF